jgi:dihydrofolate synthase / folylpolyglutamate synthase
MTYKETLDYLYTQLPVYHRIGKAAYKADLNNTIVLDKHFGNPHKCFRSIHIAGTNGKGSVSHMLSSVLQEAGYMTGLYTSPHLRDYRERIKINGKMIPEQDVVSFVENNRDILERLKPSFFEMSVAMAFDFFARSSVDIAVIETGLGGRLDSTNIITPLLSVVTNIGHDHKELLGDTLGKIAFEKAGIIKEAVPVVIGERHTETSGIFSLRAKEMNSPIFFTEDNYICELEDFNPMLSYRKYRVSKNGSSSFQGETSLLGDYQKKNIPLVYNSAELLKKDLKISNENISKGIRNTVINTGLEGRWQILRHKPLIICDTGHNLEGIEFVTKQLNSISKKRLHIILGFVNDKDISQVLPLFPTEALYYFTKASVPRALDESVLKNSAEIYGLGGASFRNVSDALKSAVLNAGTEDMIFIGGSTFIVADALSLF